MTANGKELMYWHSNKEWYRVNYEKSCYELTEKAPQKAIDSFEKWKNHMQKEYDANK